MSRLIGNVAVGGVWYGPSYPEAGDPPLGSVTNPAAWEDGAVPGISSDDDQSAPPPSGDSPGDPGGAGGDADAPAGGDGPPVADAPVPPPTAGPGSSVEHWRQYASGLDVKVAPNAKRSDIIEAVSAAGFPVE